MGFQLSITNKFFLAFFLIAIVFLKPQAILAQAIPDNSLITPKNVVPEFSLIVNKDSVPGQLSIKVGTSQFPINSFFSFQDSVSGGWNSLPKNTSSQAGWSVRVEEVTPSIKYVIYGESNEYKITRTVEKLQGKVKVSDNIINKLDSDLALMTKNYLQFSGQTINQENLYLAGIKLSTSNCQPSVLHSCEANFLDPLTPAETLSNKYSISKIDREASAINGNRTLFYTDGVNGLGLFAEDNATRVHAKLWVEQISKQGGIVDTNFMLSPKGQYTKVWFIYPTNSSDYFDFINPLRNDLGVNFTIQGSTLVGNTYIDSLTTMATNTDATVSASLSKGIFAQKKGVYIDFFHQNLSQYFARTGTKYPILFMPLQEVADPNPDYGFPMAFGTSFVKDSGQKETARLQTILSQIHQGAPDTKVLMYFNRWLSAEDYRHSLCADRPIYTDSRVLNSRGNQFSQAGYYSHYPTIEQPDGNSKSITFNICYYYGQQGNSYYSSNKQVVEKAVNTVGFDGIFFDEFDNKTMGTTYNAQDGVTADINPKTFKIDRKKANLTLLTLSAQIEMVDYLQSRGKEIVAGFPPLTKELTAKHFPRFVEARADSLDGKEVALSHLYTPILYAFPKLNDEITSRLRQSLQYGSLLYHSYISYDFDNNISQKIYPITPLELHKGYIIGKEKIITTVSGNYGYKDFSGLQVYIYDNNGALVSSKNMTKFDNTNNYNYVSVQLEQAQIAIIERTDSTALSGNLYINDGPNSINNRPAQIVNNNKIILKSSNGYERVVTTADRGGRDIPPGYYVIRGVPVNQTYTFTVQDTAPGYRAPLTTYKVGSDLNVENTINIGLLPANYAISGTLFIAPDLTNRPESLDGHQISIDGNGIHEVTTTTVREGQHGYYVFRYLLPGQYEVKVLDLPAGYTTESSAKFTLSDSLIKTVNFALKF